MMSLSTQSSLKIYVVVILSSLLFVLLTTLIDKIRLFAFEKLGINHLVNKASSLFEKISDYY